MATAMAGLGGAGGQGQVRLRSHSQLNASGGQAAQAVWAQRVSGPPAVHLTGSWPIGVWDRPPVLLTPGSMN